MIRRLLQGLTGQLALRPQTTALIYYPTAHEHTIFTWQELAEQAAARASWLRTTINPGTAIFIIAHDPLCQLQWWLGSLLADATPGILTPPTAKLDLTRYRRELDGLFARHPDAIVLYGTGIFPVPPVQRRYLDISNWTASPQSGARFVRTLDPHHACIYQQSSGTTGVRKGIVLSEEAVVAQLTSYAASLDIREDDRIISWLPLYHDMGLVACAALSIFAGLPLILTSPFVWLQSPRWWIDATAEHRATLSWLPNFAFNLLTDRVNPMSCASNSLNTLRGIINCSEPVRDSSISRFASAFNSVGLNPTSLSTCYAMAENTFAVTQTALERSISIDVVDVDELERNGKAVPAAHGRTFVGSGSPIDGTKVRIQIPRGEASEREVGDILIQSRYMMSRYENAASPAEVFDSNGWFNTGDIGYFADGDLFVIGRKKDIIIRGGRNLDPSLFEAAASSVAGVRPGRVVAIGIANEQAGTDDLVIIAERIGNEPGESAIRTNIVAACGFQVGLVPQRIALVPRGWLSKSSSGKISRAACKAKYVQLGSPAA